MSQLFTLPTELQLSIARRLDVRSRLALEATCRDAAPLAVHVALFEFKLFGKRLEEFTALDCDVCLERIRVGPSPLTLADSSSRKKGHIMPIYEAHDPEAESVRIAHEGEAGAGSSAARKLLPRARFTVNQHPCIRAVLPVALDPSKSSIGIAGAVLTSDAIQVHQAPAPRKPQISLKTSLIVLDLSRAHGVAAIAAAGLTALQTACLPPSARVVCLDGCAALTHLRPTNGCQALQSLRLDGCRHLGASSFRDHSWQPTCLEELDLCWCTSLDAPCVLVDLLQKAVHLRSLALRGLCLTGVLEALPASALPALAAIDMGFCSGLDSESVRALATSRPGLMRCNLRAASHVSVLVYNVIGQLAQARAAAASAAASAAGGSSSGDVIENRRRPRHLDPREVAPFFYLKR